MSANIRHGEIIFIREIPSLGMKSGDSVRVLGKLKELDPDTNLAIIEHDGCALKVDISLLDSIPFKILSLFQFIGELAENDEEELYLKARVARNVDGMDLSLYEKGLDLRRKFLQNFQT